MEDNNKPRLSKTRAVLAMLAVLAVMLELQSYVSIFVGELLLPVFANNTIVDNLYDFYVGYLEYFSSAEALAWVSFLYSIVGIIVFFAWYKNLRKEDSFSIKKPSDLTNRPAEMIAGLVVSCVALGFFAQAIVSVITIVLPTWVMEFEELMEMAGFAGDVPAVLLVYACITGPIVEELGIRGVGFTYARRAYGVNSAIIMQAILFGIMHMNKVQFIYTFFVGLAFGYMVYKFDNLWISIFAHIIYNLVATFGSAFVQVSLASPIIFYLTVFGSLACLYGGLLLLKKAAPIVKEMPKSSDN